MILISLLAIFVMLPGFSSTDIPVAVPDFTGTWKIDRELSSPRAMSDLDDLTLVVSQSLPELHVKRIIDEKKHKQRVSEQTYFTDGRGEKVSWLLSNEKLDSKTFWLKDSIVSKFTVTECISTTSDFYFADYKETWELLQHGNTLVITTEKTVRNVPDFYSPTYTGETYRKVFHRAIT